MSVKGAAGRRVRPSALGVARRITQATFLLLFGLLVFFAAYPPLRTPASNILLRLDPISAVYSVISTRSLAVIAGFWPAWVLLGLTALAGRFFCGWLCPLGTCFDAVGALKPESLCYYRPGGKDVRELRGATLRAPGGRRPARIPAWLRPKYLLLALVLGLAFAKVDMLFFASPTVIMNSTFYSLMLPAVPFLFIALLVIAFFYRPRFWCESICPAGALMSAVSLVGRRLPSAAAPLCVIKDPGACTSCGACYRQCGFGLSEPFTSRREGRLRSADCTLCGQCVSACPEGGALALQCFGLTLSASGKKGAKRERSQDRSSTTAPRGAGDNENECNPTVPDAARNRLGLSRGEFIGSLGVGAALLAGYGLGLRKTEESVLRMPGAQDESRFLARCNRCLECARACPTGCLMPMSLDSGLQKFWTPRFLPREAACVFDQCGQACQAVCPAGAIERVDPEKVRIGIAHVNKQTCLGWRGKSCLVCKERCRFQAVSLNGLRPSVIQNACTGCGACEETCPNDPPSIVVFPHGVSASWQGGGGRGRGRGRGG